MKLDILLIILATLLGGIGQLFFKYASTSITGSKLITILQQIVFNRNTVIGVILYGLATILYIYALKHEELSTLAPLIALSYLWATLLGIIILGEQATLTKLLGLLLIVVGAALVISKS